MTKRVKDILIMSDISRRENDLSYVKNLEVFIFDKVEKEKKLSSV